MYIGMQNIVFVTSSFLFDKTRFLYLNKVYARLPSLEFEKVKFVKIVYVSH